jgi:hypothetical protein
MFHDPDGISLVERSLVHGGIFRQISSGHYKIGQCFQKNSKKDNFETVG